MQEYVELAVATSRDCKTMKPTMVGSVLCQPSLLLIGVRDDVDCETWKGAAPRGLWWD